MERSNGSSRRQSMLGLCVGLLAAACESTAPNGWITPDPPPGGFAGAASFAGTTSFAGGGSFSGAPSFAGTTSFAGGGSFSGGGSSGLRLVVPTDNRPVVTAEIPPPPLSGGTLSTTADGAYLVAADPERDRVLFVDIATRLVTGDFPLTPGDEPGRLLAGPGQQMFVALRRSGAIVTLDPALGEVARRSACLAPRGLAYDTPSDALHVACADGKLVTFTGAAAEPTRVLDLDTDLRDVLVSDGRLWVTRMRSAELIEVGSDGTILQRLKPPTLPGTVSAEPPLGGFAGSGNVSATSNFSPAVAWRTVRGPDGTLHMLHQRGQDNDVGLGHHGDDDDANNGAVFQADPYGGGGNPCGSIVRNGITKFSPDDSIMTELAPSLPLTVDIAISPSGDYIAVAAAGMPDANAPVPTFENSFGSGGVGGTAGFATPGVPFTGGSSVQVMMRPDFEPSNSADQCDFDQVGIFVPEATTAVTFGPSDNGTLFAQTRTQLYFIDLINGPVEAIALPNPASADTGFDLFHRSAGAGVACASCHPEGSDDGRVWNFAGLGPRRSQALNVGLGTTAPFHWDGTLANVGALMDEVFVGRMGGVHQSPARLAALEGWLFSIKSQPPRRAATDELALRGKALFESEAVGCSTCHSGAAFTNNLSYTVGTSASAELFQVPSLIGISYRSPLMHTGCAATLRDRFEPSCGGGDLHGITSTLLPEDIDALVAYLETL
jgi:hypothetical protein